MGRDLKGEWWALADDLGQACLDVLGGKTVTTQRPLDPKVLAIKLMARSLQHFRGTLLLLEHDLVVEARTLARSLWENAFWMAELIANGDQFVERMRQEEFQSRKSRAEFIFANGFTLDAAVEEKMREMLRETGKVMEKKPAKGVGFSPKQVAMNGVLKTGYLYYSQLSADAAHPSLTALGRHDGEGNSSEDRVIEAVPPVKLDEVIQTMDFACNAMLALGIGLNQILEGTPAGAQFNQLADRYQAIPKRY